ncbi:effector-associated constant component EACC1 [Nocardia pseudovaccinii]|uniref:effector-associated constant component EACC1 n=1 Tax=Nocardia pseudovaccinii TaxID=189540 RepID=UPI0007A3CE48|nr:hypothetical protein [Nocardia pseudovaccinii]
MNLTIAVDAERADELRSLDRELVDVEELRGLVRRQAAPPRDGELGTLDEVLIVALGQGGAAGALTTALVAWLRRRVGSVTVRLTRSDSSVLEVNAQHVRNLSADKLMELTARLQTELDSGRGTDR